MNKHEEVVSELVPICQIKAKKLRFLECSGGNDSICDGESTKEMIIRNSNKLVACPALVMKHIDSNCHVFRSKDVRDENGEVIKKGKIQVTSLNDQSIPVEYIKDNKLKTDLVMNYTSAVDGKLERSLRTAKQEYEKQVANIVAEHAAARAEAAELLRS